MIAKPMEVNIIKKKELELQKKCLQLIELWIKSVKGPKWQHLAQAASKSNLEGLATVLNEELQLNGQKELQESVDETKEGKYKIASKINLCVYYIASSYFVYTYHIAEKFGDVGESSMIHQAT